MKLVFPESFVYVFPQLLLPVKSKLMLWLTVLERVSRFFSVVVMLG